MKRTIFLASALTTLMVTTSGCSTLHKAMGFEKQPPDEYTVVENAPLTLPPDFGLRAPSADSSKPAQSSTEERAREAVFTAGNTAATADASSAGGDLSPGEAALLKGAGATSANSAIRDQIDQAAVQCASGVHWRLRHATASRVLARATPDAEMHAAR